MPNAKGTFEILSLGEDAYHERDGEPKLTHASGDQRFAGDIEGDGSVHWLMCYRPDKTARLVGIQRIEGSIGGRRGSFLIEASGDHNGKSSEGTWRVIPGSGTNELAGIHGTGAFEAPSGPNATYHLEYEIE